MKNLKRSFHPARKHPSPVMVPEHPWEGVGTALYPSVYLFGDVIWDEAQETYRMWYTSATKDLKGPHRVLYATSKDGIRWHKPLDLEIVNYGDSYENNILIQNCSAENVLIIKADDTRADGKPLTGVRGCSGFCVLDAHQQPVPHARGRYTAMFRAWVPGRHGGLSLAYSDDGRPVPGRPGQPFGKCPFMDSDPALERR